MENSNKNIFVLFSPGLGGNHVANLLSTDNRYKTRANSNDYQSHKEQNAHIILNNLDNLPKVKENFGNIFCGHFGEYYWQALRKNLARFKNRQIIIIELPKDNNSLAFKRYKKYTKLNEYFIEEQRSLYSFYSIEQFFKENDLFSVPSEMIFNNSVNKFYDYANQEMNFNLDYSECNKMHNIWINKIKDYLEHETVS